MQDIIIKGLLTNQDFTRSVMSHLNTEFFEGKYRRLFEGLQGFFVENNIVPSEDVALHIVDTLPKLKKEDVSDLREFVEKAYTKPIDDRVVPYLVEKTEKWGLERSVYNAIVYGIGQLEESDKNFGEVYDRIRSAVAYSFNDSIGMTYFGDAEERYAQYKDIASKRSFGLKALDDLTDGGYEAGTLNMFSAGTGGGKSIALVNVAVAALLRGESVLYITLEMAEKKIYERVDAKLLNVPVWQVKKMKHDEYIPMVQRLQSQTTGEMIVKQYPTSSASALDFRNLIDELRLKKGFVPDLVVIDYLGICADARGSGKDNTYVAQKHIAEDLRAIGIDYQIAVFSAVQLNRSGLNNSDAQISNIAESMAVAHTADSLFSIYQSEELAETNQALISVLKNRYGPNDASAVVGLNKEYMSFYNIDGAHSYDNSQTGKNTTKVEELTGGSSRLKKDVSGFKFG
jgi:hypothetical protein